MINVLYCGDRNILDGLIISTLSLAKNTHQSLNIFVFTMKRKGYREITQKNITALEKVLQQKNPKHRVHLIDVTEQFESDAPRANAKNLFTPYCLLRLYADLVPDLPDKILYLDTDVVALKGAVKAPAIGLQRQLRHLLVLRRGRVRNRVATTHAPPHPSYPHASARPDLTQYLC